MIWRVEIQEKEGIKDSAGESVARDIADLGIRGIAQVRVVLVYLLEGDLSRQQAVTIVNNF